MKWNERNMDLNEKWALNIKNSLNCGTVAIIQHVTKNKIYKYKKNNNNDNNNNLNYLCISTMLFLLHKK